MSLHYQQNEITALYYRQEVLSSLYSTQNKIFSGLTTETPHIKNGAVLFTPTATNQTPSINEYIMKFRPGGGVYQRGIIDRDSDRINFNQSIRWGDVNADRTPSDGQDPTGQVGVHTQPSFLVNRLGVSNTQTVSFSNFNLWPRQGIEAGDNNFVYVFGNTVALRERISVLDLGVDPDLDSEVLGILTAVSNTFLRIWNSRNKRFVDIPFISGDNTQNWEISNEGVASERMRWRPPLINGSSDTPLARALWDVFCDTSHHPIKSMLWEDLHRPVQFSGNIYYVRDNFIFDNYAPTETHTNTDAVDVGVLNAAGQPRTDEIYLFLFYDETS